MLDIAKLKTKLIESGTIQRAQMERAQEHSIEKGVPLCEALLALHLVGYGKLGECLSEICEIPYVRLQGQPLPPEVRGMLPDSLAVRWKTIPVDFNARENILTLAICDPDQTRKIEQCFRFLMQPYALGFVLVSQPELDKLFATHYGITHKSVSARPDPKAVRSDGKLVLKALHEKTDAAPADDASRDRAPATPATGSSPRKLSRYSPLAAMNRATAAEATPKTGEAASDIGRTLLKSVEMLVEARLGDQAARRTQTKDCVRYCRMMSVRMNLSPDRSDVLTLAAWLSALDNGREVARQLALPCDMDAILCDGEIRPDTAPERQIIALVKLYQDMRENDQTAARDINAVRARLRAHWSADPDLAVVLEAFLQALMDDEFLSDVHSPPTASEGGVKGSLTDMSFADMIQILCAGGKNMDIALSRNGEKALVCVRDGEVAHASLNEQAGKAAFYKIAQWCEGEFVARPQADLPIRTIHESLMGLLMGSTRLADESSARTEPPN
jgi:hypothetical protein